MIVDDHQPPRAAFAVLTWHGDDVRALDLPEHHAARDSRCSRDAEPLCEREQPRYTYPRSHRNLDTRLRELDAQLERDAKRRPKQLSADEVAEHIRRVGRIPEDVHRRDPVLALAIAVQAYVLFGQLPTDPRAVERKGPMARFSGAAAVLRSATTRTALLGVSAASYAVAESRGRTVARWGEIDCKPSHPGGSRPRALGAVERELDAVVGVSRAAVVIDPVDFEGLRLWLVDPPKVQGPKGPRIDWETILLRFRRRIAGLQPGASGPLTLTAAEWSDKALQERLRRAKRRFEERLRAIPEAAAELAGNVSAEMREELGLLRGLIPEAKKRESASRTPRERAIPVLRSEAGR